MKKLLDKLSHFNMDFGIKFILFPDGWWESWSYNPQLGERSFGFRLVFILLTLDVIYYAEKQTGPRLTQNTTP